MSEISDLKQQVAEITQRLNQITAQARTIDEFPEQNPLVPSSLLHAYNAGVSQKIIIQQILDAALSYRQNQLVSIGTITVSGNNVTVPAGAQWVIDNIDYSNPSNIVTNHPYAATGYTRNDILVADKTNNIYKVTGPETAGVSPAPNVPLNTVLVTTINVTDSTIGYVPPEIGNDYEVKTNKQNSLDVDGTGKKYVTVDAVNAILPTIIVPDATTTVKGKLKLAGDLGGTADLPTVPSLINKADKRPSLIYADDYPNLTSAIAATPAGGTLMLSNTTYTGKISVTRDNISIVGSTMPTYDSTTDKLIGGSIINGTFVIDGSNVSLRNLGIDCGTAQCVALNSGNPMEGLIMHDTPALVINTNNRAENIISIVKAGSSMHSVLFEGLANSYFNNVHGKGGAFGVVFKVSDSNASNIFGYEAGTTNIYIKSDSYAPCLRSNFTNLYSISNVVASSQPVAIHASTSNLFDINVSNVNIFGGDRQFRLIASPAVTPTYVMSNVSVSNVVMESGVSVGLDTYGVVYNSSFNNILVRNTTSGQGIFSDGNGRGINFSNIRFDDNSGNNLDTAVDFRSGCIVNNVVSIRNADQTNLGGINFAGNIGGFELGEYIGNLKIGGVAANRKKIIGQGTALYVPKYNSAGVIQSSLFYDDGLNGAFNAAPYSLGGGWSLFSINNTTGSGFVNQVNNVPALRSSSNASSSGFIELRNLPLLLGVNGSEKARIHASGGLSIGNTTDLGAGTLNVTGNVRTVPGINANDAVTVSQLNAAVPTGVKRYKVFIAQSGSSAPIVTVLENSIGAIVWTRSATGNYIGTLSGAFTANKVFANFQYKTYTVGQSFTSAAESTTTSTINIYSFSSGTAADSILQGYLLIEIYP